MNLKNTIVFLFALISFTAFISYGQPEHKTLEIGSKASDFDLQGIDGKFYSLNSFSNAEILVIIFTANHCPTAQAYEDRIIKLTNDYKHKGVDIICVSSNNPDALRLDEMGYTDLGDTKEEMKIRAKDKGFNFPYLYDGDKQEVAEKYGPQATPHVFIFDKDRILRYAGRIDNSEKIQNVSINDTRNAIDALLAGKEVQVKQTKTFGCSLKWAYKKESAKEAVEKWNKEKVELQSVGLDEIKNILKNESDNLRLVNIWSTWCGPCAAEFPDIIEINRMYRNREFEMITLSTDDISKKDKVQKFLEKNYASTKNYQYNSDDKYKLIDAVDKEWSGALPYTLLVKPNGEIIYKKEGMIDDLLLKKAIVSYLGRYYK
ncbi:MAG: redoxin domain-containing protein [Ignavibacteriaceae bacterium]